MLDRTLTDTRPAPDSGAEPAVSTSRPGPEAADDLLEKVVRELRTPLLSVVGFTDLLGERLAGTLDPEDRSHFERLKANAQALVRQLDDLTALAQVASARDIDDVALGEVATTVALDLRHRRPRVRVDVSRMPVVKMSERLAHELFARLLDNAVAHSERPDPTVEVSTVVHTTGAIEVTLTDDGRGIPERDLESVFEPFHRLHRTPECGAGMGLTICRRIMDTLGGSIAAGRAPGGGCRISMTFPPALVLGWDTSQ